MNAIDLNFRENADPLKKLKAFRYHENVFSY